MIIKEINPEYSLEGLMLKLQLQYLGHLMQEPTCWKRPWCWERLRAGGEGGDRGWDGWMASPAQWTRISANSGRSWRTGKPGVLQSMGLQRVGYNLATEQQQDAWSWVRRASFSVKAARAGCHQEGPWEEWGGAWSRSPCTAQEMPDLTFCLISALGCRIWASCNGFLGRSGTGSWILLRGLRGWAL